MKIEYVLFASFSNQLPSDAKGNTCTIDIEKGSTVEALLAKLRLPPDKPKIIFVNHRRRTTEAVLSEGDRVAVFPLVAGG